MLNLLEALGEGGRVCGHPPPGLAAWHPAVAAEVLPEQVTTTININRPSAHARQMHAEHTHQTTTGTTTWNPDQLTEEEKLSNKDFGVVLLAAAVALFLCSV